MIWWILGILFFLLLIYYCFDVYFIKDDTIICFTGGLGSGKSVCSFKKVNKLIKRNTFLRARKNLKTFVKNWFRSKNDRQAYLPRPMVYSSIPICFRRFIWSRKEYSLKLKYEHLLLVERQIPLSVTYIDEIGSFANQFEFKNPNILDNFNEYIRLYRHYTLGGYLVCNDQCSDNIVLEVRRRINNVYNLSKFRRIPIIPFVFAIYWVKCRNISISEEIKTIETNNKEDNMRNLFGIMPRRWNFDTYCYSVRYDSVPYNYENYYDSLKTHHLLDYPKSTRVKKKTE